MNYYKKNGNIGLAKDIEINSDANTNIFTINDNMSDIFDSFLATNITRNIGSYIIFDKNNEIYNLYQSKLKTSDYRTELYNLNETFNLFNVLTGENDIQRLVKAVLRNCPEIQRYLYEGKTEIDLLYTQTDLILTLILIYIVENAPMEKRNFKYINKVLYMLNQNDLAYFKKIFGNVDNSYAIQSSIFHLDYMKDEEYKKSLSILINILSKTSDTKTNKTTILNSITSLYTTDSLKLIFVELSDITVVDSFVCSYIEENCNKPHASEQVNSVFYVYSSLEQIGYIPNFIGLLENLHKNNDIHILSFNSVTTAVRLYGKDIRTIMQNIQYGLLFQTKKEKDVQLVQKLLSNDTIPLLMNQIQSNMELCVVYQKKKGCTIEHKITQEQ